MRDDQGQMATYDMTIEKTIGPFTVTLEEPDLAIVKAAGDLLPSAIRALTDELHRFSDGKPYIFVIADFAQAGRLSAEARKTGAEVTAGLKVVATAFLRTSFHYRVFMLLIAKAVSFLRGEEYKVDFFETEPEARAWLDRRRAEIQASRSKRAR